MQPWKTASREQIAAWIRGAAMCQWANDNLEDWHNLRRTEDDWTVEQSNTFVVMYKADINRAKKAIDKWLDGTTNTL